ncbi:MAG: hypothetical protein ABIU54_11150 [Candidatus Eisenbacteria bacterium]
MSLLRRSILLALALCALGAMPARSQTARSAKPAPTVMPPAPVTVSAKAAITLAPLAEAQQLYNDSHFEQAATLLADALRTGRITGDDVNVARALRARCLAKLGRRLESKEAFKAVLRSDPGYRPDEMSVPPDELEMYRIARKEFQAEQVEAGKRYPSSIGFWAGKGQAVNQDLVDLASSAGAGPADDFAANTEFGFSVRFPIKPRWSVDFEVARLLAETQDKLPSTRNAHATYKAKALPLVVSVLRHFVDRPKLHVSGFGGVGLMMSEAIIEFPQSLVGGRVIPTQFVGEAIGKYAHLGFEAEYHLQPRLALAGRVLARYANSGELDWPRKDFELYESYPASLVGSRDMDFSGLAAHVGVRAYIGY